MASELTVEGISSLLDSIYDNSVVVSDTKNWFQVLHGSEETIVYVSQCKPSAFGKANWYYEFYHSVAGTAIQKILDRRARVLLIDYMSRR